MATYKEKFDFYCSLIEKALARAEVAGRMDAEDHRRARADLDYARSCNCELGRAFQDHVSALAVELALWKPAAGGVSAHTPQEGPCAAKRAWLKDKFGSAEIGMPIRITR